MSDPYETLRAAKKWVLVTLQFVFLTLKFSKLSTENPYLAQNLSTDPLWPQSTPGKSSRINFHLNGPLNFISSWMTSLFILVPYYCFGTFQKNKLTGYSSGWCVWKSKNSLCSSSQIMSFGICWKKPGSVKQWKEKSDRTQSPLTPFYYTDNSMCATK